MENQSADQKTWQRTKNSVAFKIILIGIVIVVLLIPSKMIMNLIEERNNRKDEAVKEISSKWGGEQVISGPVITIPYKGTMKNDQGNPVIVTRYLHFLPENLTVDAVLYPEIRYRGIYKVVLYKSKLNISGEFLFPDFSGQNIDNNDIYWNQSYVSIGIPDMRGIKDGFEASFNDKKLAFKPEIENNDLFSSGLSSSINLLSLKPDSQPGTLEKGLIRFKIKLFLNGSNAIRFVPFGKTTEVTVQSAWADPSFDGVFLPETRKITTSGFNASWKVLYMNRTFSQIFTDGRYGKTTDDFLPLEIGACNFGVSLMVPVNEYQKTSRSAKYDVLFIFLTFLAFFFVEVINKRRIHPLQYLLVGFAIILFYVLLLSLSEYLSFNISYLVSSAAIIALVAFYSKSVLRSHFLGILMAMILSVLYIFFFIILQLQDYALLFGSIGLFIILAVVMYLSRNINWYQNNEMIKNEIVTVPEIHIDQAETPENN